MTELARLQELQRMRRLRSPWLGWLVGLSSALVVASIFLRVPEANIALDLRLSAVRFTVREDTQLDSSLQLKEVGISGLGGFRLPASSQGGLGGSHEVASNLYLKPGLKDGKIELAPLTLPKGAEIEIRRLDPEGSRHLISLLGSKGAKLNVLGHLEVLSSNSYEKRSLELRVPSAISLEPRSGEPLELSAERSPLPPDQTQEHSLGQHIRVDDLRLLLPVDLLESRSRLHPRLVSTILDGSLYFDGLGGKERPLRRGEVLQVMDPIGDLSFLGVDSEGLLILRFEGQVRGLVVGRSKIDLMPTWFEAGNVEYPLSFFIAGLAAVATLFAAVRS